MCGEQRGKDYTVFFKGKNPCVVAGLLAGMGLGAALGAAPVAAIAEDATVVVSDANTVQVVEDAPEQQVEVVEPTADDETAVPEEKAVVADEPASDASVAADEVAKADDAASKAEDAAGDSKSEGAAAKSDEAGDAVDADSKSGSDDAENDAVDAKDDTKDDAKADAKADTVTAEESASVDGAETVKKVEDAAAKKSEESKAADAAKQVVAQSATVSVENVSATTEAPSYKNQWVKSSDGSSYYWYDQNGKQVTSGMVVTSVRFDGTDKGEMQRYYIESATKSVSFAKVLNVTWETGVKGYAYSTKYGYLARGKYSETDAKGNVLTYLADGNGKLENTGWLVTDKYDGGGLQRYYIDPTQHCAVQGYSTAGGYEHYTTTKGYVARGKYTETSGSTKGYVYLANGDGKLEHTGWLVTDKYDGGGLQRYYIDPTAHAAIPGQSSAGYLHYTTSNGYVLRGFTSEGGVKRYGNGDGLLTTGWIVTGYYTNGNLHRYYQKNGKFLTSQFFNDGGYWAYAWSNGQVLRGKGSVGGYLYVADGDGRLATNVGWVVTDKYDGGGLQRYYFERTEGKAYSHAVTGIFKAKLENSNYYSWFYGSPTQGYELRGKMKVSEGVIMADGDGRVNNASTGWLVTGTYDGGGLQRYYMVNTGKGYSAAKVGFFQAKLENSNYNSWFYGSSSEGYVLRGKLKTSDGIVMADGDGRIETSSGWIVTGKYDGGGLQRYYMVRNSSGYSVAKTGYFQAKLENSDKTTWFYGNTSQGYVARGATKFSSGVLLANGDGILLESLFPSQKANTWLVTTVFAGYAQRYYVISADGHLLTKYGKFTTQDEHGKTYTYYGREDTGAVVIGTYTAPNGQVYRGDNDGHLITVGWFKMNGSWYWMYSNGNSTRFTNAAYSAWNSIKNWSSSTSYLICVDNSNLRTIIFQGSAGNWTPVRDVLCSVGKNPSNAAEVAEGYGATVRGVYSIIRKGYVMGNDPDYYYWTEFWQPHAGEEGQRFHSRPYWRNASRTPGALCDNGNFGKAQTHGCVRLNVEDVKFIYDYCPVGTKVYSY